MKQILYVALFATSSLFAQTSNHFYEVKKSILEDPSFEVVDSMAHAVVASGLNAGSGYGEVWIRDFNTFITTAMDVMSDAKIRECLNTFFHFQGKDGNIVDGYIPIEKADLDNVGGYKYRLSASAPNFAAHKNTVETDHEASLIQAVRQYVEKSGNVAYLDSKVDGITVRRRMEMALEYLMNDKYDSTYGLITGATTADWGDVQPEHLWGVEIDENTHFAIDIYDNAMFVLAIHDFLKVAGDAAATEKWNTVATTIKKNVRKHLWDEKNRKFIPHIYLKDSPFAKKLDENQIYYHGGTAVAALAGILSKDEVGEANERMLENVRKAHAETIGLTMYPAYPAGSFKGLGMYPYGYQNGGDWTWFGARMIWALVENGYIEEAYTELQPMLKRVIRNQGFNEWYTPAGEPKGSGTFRGEAGVLVTAMRMLKEWAANYESVTLDETKNTTVLFTFGQSNSANYGQGHFYPKSTVYNYFNGHVCKAQDPLIGATGYGAGPWTRLGEKMNESGFSKGVTIVPIGIGSSSVANWAKGGKYHALLLETIEKTLKDGIHIDYILWHQGENDNVHGTSKEMYKKRFLEIREAFRSRGINAPIVVALATYHPKADLEKGGVSQTIREAQKELASEYEDIYAGPDTDKLNMTYHRADGVHFSTFGQNLHAEGWLKAIRKIKK